MPDPSFKHISPAMEGDVVVVLIKTKEFQQPMMAQELGNELSRVMPEFRAKKVLLDFAPVTYLGSVAFAALSRVVKNVKSAGGQIKFCNMAPSVERATNIIFSVDIVGSQNAVEIHDTRARALASFAMA